MATQRSGGRQKGEHVKISWWLPLDVVATIRAEAARLDLNEGRLLTAIIRERVASLHSDPVQRYAMEQSNPMPINEAKHRMKQTLAEFS